MKKKIFTLMTLALLSIGSAWAGFPDANYLLLNGSTKNSIAASQVVGSISFTCNTDKYTYQATTCKFNGNSISQGLKTEGATYTDFTLASTASVTIVQSLANNPDTSLSFDLSSNSGKKELSTWDDVIVSTYEGTGDANNQNVKIFKICNVPAGTYRIKQNSGQTFMVYVGVTYGETTKVTIDANTSKGGTSTIDGTGDYLPGSTATLTAVPAAGKALDHWELGGANVSTANPYSFTVTTAATYTAVFIDAATKTISVGSADDAAGTGAASATTVSEGGSTTLTATVTAAEGYVFSNWTKSSDGSWSSTTNPLTISYDDLTDGDAYTANFKALYTVTYDLGTYAGTTTKVLNNYNATNNINEKYANAEDKYTIPSYAHRYLYREGYRLTGWSDGVNTYETGEEITLTANTTLTPVWVATTQTLANSASETTVTWTLDKAQILFNAWQNSPQVGYYTKPHTINGELIAVPMKVDATGGKVDNSSRSGNTQINKGTTFTIPAVSGMKITVNRTDNNDWSAEDPKTTVNDENMTVGDKVATYTYTGSADEVTIALNAGRYYTSIKVTYPAMTIAKEITSAGYATFVPSDKVSVPSGVKAYIVTATDATTATLSDDDAITVIPANAPVVIKGDAGTYYFPKTTADPSDITGNKLTTSATTANGTQYILADGTSGVGFYKATPKTEIAAGVAYLVSPSGSAPYFIFGIEGGTTGINAVQGSEFTVNGEYYNLAGQRVAQPTKGLYIVNGKKVVVK